jgi:hypothetical protein
VDRGEGRVFQEFDGNTAEGPIFGSPGDEGRFIQFCAVPGENGTKEGRAAEPSLEYNDLLACIVCALKDFP